METVELTELEKLEVSRVDGVASPANGFPVLLLKSLAKAPMDADGKTEGPTHGAFDGTHTHDHAFGDDTHSHSHAHDGDGDHGHAHATKADGKVDCPTCKGDGKIMGNSRDCPDCDASGKVTPAKAKSLAAKSAGPPGWHAGAKVLTQLAKALPGAPPDSLWLSMRWAQPDLFDQAAKAIAADGSVDEQPDIDGGKQAIALIAKLIGYEADELAAGCLNETWDIQLLCEAAGALKCWLGGEQATADGVGELMQGAAKAAESAKTQNDLPDSAFAYIEPGGEKDEEGKTTPRSKRHFPVHDEAHARNALARLSSSPFGDKAKAKVHAAAKKFGIEVSDTSKSTVAEGGTDVQTDAQGTGDLTEVVKAAVTEATADLRAQLATAQAGLAKVMAAPVPGGPMMSVTRPAKAADDDHAVKALRYETQAETMADPREADLYRKLAAQERAKITSS